MPNPILALVFPVLFLVIFVGTLVCYILVVIQMFQRGKTGPGLTSTIGLLACGLGSLFAFVYGWMKAGEWRLKNVMIAWTVLIVLYFGMVGVYMALVMPGAIQAAREAAIKQQKANEAKAKAGAEEAAPAPETAPAPAPAPAPEK